MKNISINDNRLLSELLQRTTRAITSKRQSLPDLTFDECLLLGDFNNIMDLVKCLLEQGRKLPGATQSAMLFLFHQGIFEYQNKAEDEGNLARDFTLNQCIEAQIKKAVNEADDEQFSLFREIIASMFDVGMSVSDEFLELINEVEYDSDEREDTDIEFSELVGHMEVLAKEIQAESCFDVYLQVAEQLNQMPADAGLLIITGLLHTADPLVRDSAILFLLHPQKKVRQSFLQGILDLAHQDLFNHYDFQRLMTIRRWLPADERSIVDQVIKRLQRNQVSLQSSENTQVLSLHAIWITPIDNSGSMILQVVFKIAKKFKLIGCILKQKHGIKDAYCSALMSKSEYNKILARSSEAMPTINASQEQLIALLSHFIEENLLADFPVPVEVLMLTEHLNDISIEPKKLTLAQVNEINRSLPLAQSPQLELEEFLYGWGSPQLAGNYRSAKALIKGEFEPERQLWLERLLITLLSFEFTLDESELFRDAIEKIQAGKALASIDFFRDVAEIILDEDLHEAPLDNPREIGEAIIQQMLEDDPSLLEKLAQINLSDEFDFAPPLVHKPQKWPAQDRPKRAVYQLKITLKGCNPAVWRRVLIMNTITLRKLHGIIQVSMGWMDDHLYEFEWNKHRIGPVDDFSYNEVFDDNSVQIRDLLFKEKGKLNYTYDFGDSWQHQIVLEKITPAAKKNTPVQVTAGTGACPPEDCGGVFGYGHMLQVLKKPNHEEYEDFIEWLNVENGKDFDPAYFDQNETNDFLNEIFN